MKRIYSIITLCLIAAATLVSCSDDANINTANATLGFEQTTLSVKESKGIFHVPVTVSGEQNGNIEFSVSVSSNDANCKEDVHYLITSKNLIMPEGTKTVNVEIKTVDDRVINDDRHFTLHLQQANGASINTANASIDITLSDNDNIPYERMAGVWTVSAINMLNGDGTERASWDINLNVVEDTNPSYGTLINTTPWAVFDGSTPVLDENGQMLSHPMSFSHNEKTGKTTVEMKMGSIMASDLNFGTGEGGVDISKATVRSATMGMTGLTYSGAITGVVNEAFDEIKFSNPVYLIVFSTNGSPYMYYGGWEDITLKLKK